MISRLKVLALALLATACSGAGDQDATPAQDTLTRAQRDSIIGASSLPGARSVQRAIDTRDSANARTGALDSLLKQP
jgi:hypothetical protein